MRTRSMFEYSYELRRKEKKIDRIRKERKENDRKEG